MAKKTSRTSERDEAHFRSRRAAIQSIGIIPVLAVIGCGSDDGVPNDAQDDGDSPASSDGGGTVVPNDDSGPAVLEDAGPPPPPAHPYVALLEEFVMAFNAHELDRALSFFSESATVRVNGRVLEGHAAIRAFLEEYGATTGATPLAGAGMGFDKALVTDDGVAMIGGRIFGAPEGEIAGFTSASFVVQMAFGGVFQLDGTNRFAACDVIVNWGAMLTTPI